MMDLMNLASMKQAEREHQLCTQCLQQTLQDEQTERSRFVKAYRLRSLVNRIAPVLAPRLGF